MNEPTSRPLHPAVLPTLDALLAAVRETLGAQFVGLYLYGSLAGGDFDPQTSDIDFVVVTDGDLNDATVNALDALHRRLWASGDKWAAKLEGSYIPQAALRRYTPGDPPRPTINEGRFYVAPHGSDWIIQRHLIREHSAVLVGPDPRTLIDPVPAEDIRTAVRGVLREWWQPMLDDPTFLERADYQAFAVLTMCRVLYTLAHGDIASKPVSARWAQDALGPRWRDLIAQAVAWRPGDPFDRMDDVLALLRLTVERSGL